MEDELMHRLFQSLLVISIIVLSGCNITVENNGNGTVFSDDELISCGEQCTASYTSAQSVTLIASPAPGYQFDGWGGACTDNDACILAMSEFSGDKRVTASFSPLPYMMSGSLTGLDGALTITLNGDEMLTLSAKDNGFEFATSLFVGDAYDITITQQPSHQTCQIENGTGTLSSEGVPAIGITCSSNLQGFPDPNVTLTGNDQQHLSFSISGVEVDNVTLRYRWSSHRVATYNGQHLPNNPVEKQIGSPSLYFVVAADYFNQHGTSTLYTSILCELQAASTNEQGEVTWTTIDSVRWAIKAPRESGSTWQGHAYIGNLNDLDDLVDVTNVSGFVILDNINFDVSNTLSALSFKKIMIENHDERASLDNLSLEGKPLSSLVLNKNTNLSSLTALSGITSLNVLRISQNPSLKTLNGLETLESVSTIRLDANDNLSSLEALGNLSRVSYLMLRNNPSLGSLAGLEKITSLNFSSMVELEIRNTGITNLNGLESLEEIRKLIISQNDDLESLSGLEKLRQVKGSLTISYNPNITSLMGLNNLEQIGYHAGQSDSSRYFSVTYNESLTSFEGIENLTYIGLLTSFRNNGYCQTQLDAFFSDFDELGTISGDLDLRGEPCP